MKVGWASRPSKKDGRDAHPTITIKIVSYLIRDPKFIVELDFNLAFLIKVEYAETLCWQAF